MYGAYVFAKFGGTFVWASSESYSSLRSIIIWVPLFVETTQNTGYVRDI